MKKRFVLFVICLLLPGLFTYGASLISDRVQIGIGTSTLQDHYLGKEVLLELQGLYKSMDVEEYVLGVLPGTIPADYDLETLKVQAILVRTNVLKEMQEKQTQDGADLSYHYMTEEERLQLWGNHNYKKNARIFEQAVADTAGMVVMQEDSLIMALYHEVSIGTTVSAKEILGEEISYLQEVDSSQDVEAKNYMHIITYNKDELQNCLQSKPGESEKENGVNIEISESTEHGYVKQVMVNGTGYTGEEIAEIFRLPSTNFYIEKQESGLRFVCLGMGSGMGLSQYGANRMAMNGKYAQEILQYYYPGVSIREYPG